MPRATKICKICGKEYEYCHTFAPKNAFRWQDVACCLEHGMEYFEEIAISRGEAIPAPEPKEDDDVKVLSEPDKEVTESVTEATTKRRRSNNK